MNTVDLIVLFLVVHELTMCMVVLRDRKNFAKMREVHQEEIFRLSDVIADLKKHNTDLAVSLTKMGNIVKTTGEHK